MSSYNIFAKYYDLLTQNIDYNAGSNFISGIFKAENVHSVIDLACGTGVMSEMLIDNGFSVLGIDYSCDMLCVAENRLSKTNGDYTLINAKMQDFSLDRKYDACVCCLDSINHLTDENDVLKTFKCVFNSLNDFGIFIFDVNTVYKHQTSLNNRAYVFDEEDFFLSWDNELLENDTVRILLDFFVYNGTSYDRYSEEFLERAYKKELLKEMLNIAGFEKIEVCGDFEHSAPTETDERLFFICYKTKR